MNDRIFDLLYKAEQREIVARLRQKEMLNRNLPEVQSSCLSFGSSLRRIWQIIVLKSGREE